jgi:hypothetical protein
MDQAAGRSLPTARNLEFRCPPKFCLTLESAGRVNDRVVDLTCFDGPGASSRKFYVESENEREVRGADLPTSMPGLR